ncbi:tubulin-folding cofactor C [Aristolochia californica]|uniref:tubulin-folding cofactor C n=1 Tax=Aristolochia californica TaxID=171875 RepID=UPI0035DB1215
MEEEKTDVSGQKQDTLSQKSKHEAMLERLSNLHQSRLQQSVSRKLGSEESSAAFESTQSFLTRFAELKHSVVASLKRCREASDPDSKSSLKSDLECISLAIEDLQRLVAENSYFLPSYEVRSSLKAISDLKESLEVANSELLPRKKFSFRNKPLKKDIIIHNRDAHLAPSQINDQLPLVSAAVKIHDSPGLRNTENSVLEKDFRAMEGGDFTLADLNSCEIRLRGRLRTLFVHRLKNCRVFVGPVFGSVLIEEVEDCLFMLASHQIRIHNAKNTNFYLRVRSTPVIEDSCGVRFAPYNLVYDGIEKDLKDSGLEEETGSWANVDDFKWLRAVQSPNWSVLPEEERVCTINISDSGTESET